jgi:hypothetical protein
MPTETPNLDAVLGILAIVIFGGGMWMLAGGVAKMDKKD